MSLYIVAAQAPGRGKNFTDYRIFDIDGPMGSRSKEAAEQFPAAPGTRLVVWGLGNFPTAFTASKVAGEVHEAERGF